MDPSENDDIFKLNLDAGCSEDSTDTLDWTNSNCILANQTLAYRQQFGSSFVPGPIRSPKRRGRPIANNAARERSRVKTLRSAFLDLQRTLPAVPPDTKLSKLDVLVLATTYIAHLMSTLADDRDISQVFAANGCMHPVKKWPMRTRLYAGILSSTLPQTTAQTHGQTHDQAAQWFTPEHDLG